MLTKTAGWLSFFWLSLVDVKRLRSEVGDEQVPAFQLDSGHDHQLAVDAEMKKKHNNNNNFSYLICQK